jgi:hypothetical protein
MYVGRATVMIKGIANRLGLKWGCQHLQWPMHAPSICPQVLLRIHDPRLAFVGWHINERKTIKLVIVRNIIVSSSCIIKQNSS